MSSTVVCAPAIEDFTPITQAYVPVCGFWRTLGQCMLQAVDQMRAKVIYQAELQL